MDDILSKSRIKPAVLQVEYHPYFNQAQLIEHCRKREIVGAFKHSTLNNSSRGKQFICVSRQSILDITGSNEKTLKFLYILYVRIRMQNTRMLKMSCHLLLCSVCMWQQLSAKVCGLQCTVTSVVLEFARCVIGNKSHCWMLYDP